MRHYLFAGVPLIVFLGIAAAVTNTLYRESAYGYSPSAIPSALIGQNHPSLDMPPLAGIQTPALNDRIIKGQVVVLNVFASWCVPCRLEHPALMELGKDTRIKLVAINYKDAPEKALAFIEENGNPFSAIGVDQSGRRAIDWGVYGIPETFIIDRHGRITHKHVGPLDERNLSGITQAIESALANY